MKEKMETTIYTEQASMQVDPALDESFLEQVGLRIVMIYNK